MEFPHLGKHCSEDHCRRLDFLPVKCDGCSKIFCGDHYSYVGHNCPAAYKKNVQVPACPLCNALIPGKADEVSLYCHFRIHGDLPDIRVSRHIDADCKSDTAVTRRTKVYNNRCSLKGCKQKELVPVLCDRCNLNYCLKHRHPQDHSCDNATGKAVNKAGLAALQRIEKKSSNNSSSATRNQTPVTTSSSNARSLFPIFNNSRPANNPSRNVSSLQGNISEEDALRMALEASLSNQGNATATDAAAALSQEQEDFMLAKALAESEMAAAGGGDPSSSNRRQQNCDIC
ncbi:AN1-type zinc finger protein 2B [Orchesella cincta]|uniref:AN1-type zinc finger protein 2B n=1 Tax=Orchesella cincta TaxID=48709 RepID=A0A1D2MGM9_ORCCI|nr:AN1-type zinc finger protein 2B [Orchesella cincta]